ncbi:MAG: TlpA family protein disulfide reductase [Sulfuricaulis sp.]
MSATFKNLLLLGTTVLALLGGYWLAQSLRHTQDHTPASTLKYGGGAMINFTLPDLDGKPQSLNNWRGKVIVINFWATWCPPCREEIPLLVALQKKYSSGDLQIIGVAVDNKTAVMLYRQSAGINYPVLIGNDDTMDLIAQYGNHTGSIPYSVIIDRSGSVVVRKLGAFSKLELNSLIAPLLPPAPSTSSPAPSST